MIDATPLDVAIAQRGSRAADGGQPPLGAAAGLNADDRVAISPHDGWAAAADGGQPPLSAMARAAPRLPGRRPAGGRATTQPPLGVAAGPNADDRVAVAPHDGWASAADGGRRPAGRRRLATARWQGQTPTTAWPSLRAAAGPPPQMAATRAAA